MKGVEQYLVYQVYEQQVATKSHDQKKFIGFKQEYLPVFQRKSSRFANEWLSVTSIMNI